MNARPLATCLFLIAVPASVLAEDARPASASEWLSLQRDQQMASPHSQAASGLAREKALERQFKTYDQAIPDKYFSDSFKSGQ